METTLLAHGVPRNEGLSLAQDLAERVREQGAEPAVVGVVDGEAIVGLSDAELERMLSSADVSKANLSNLGLLRHRAAMGATTVSGTMALCAAVGVRVFATGGIGGVHPGYGQQWDVSADLMALSKYPVAVVTSGCKTVLDVVATREALETLGVPVVGVGTHHFPAFYLRESAASVDARFDDFDDLARYIRLELSQGNNGVVVANPIAETDAIDEVSWERWLAQARDRVAQEGVTGRGVTPALLGALHDISDGATLRANLALVRSNAVVAAKLAVALRRLEDRKA